MRKGNPTLRETPRQSPLAGRLALITGANRGIGLAIARLLASEGCNLIITGRDERALARASRELNKLSPNARNININILAQACDVRSPDAVNYLFTLVRGLHHPLDILINNAGIGHPNRSIGDLPYSTWTEVIDTNLNGLFLVTQSALTLMKRGSTIVNNLSIAAEQVFPGSAAYNASKHGALRFRQHPPRGVAPEGNSRDQPVTRSHRYCNLEYSLAKSAKTQNDVPRNHSPRRSRRPAVAADHDDRKNRNQALHRYVVEAGTMTLASWRCKEEQPRSPIEHPI